MNRPTVFASESSTSEARPLWSDNRVWWVNCVAVECAWAPHAAAFELPVLRQRRDALLDAFINNW